MDPPSQSTKVLSADGKLIATFYAENRVKVSLDQMSPYIKDAIVAIEDRRFYEHAGVDPQGILRALSSNLSGGGRQGASTLTQQYVTNVRQRVPRVCGQGRSRSSSAGRRPSADKMREMKLAIELEKKYTKDQILEGYLNIVFFNRDAYGIEAASRYFFSTTAKDLTLPQAALLAGLVNSPSFYDPAVHPENALQRRNQVLASMLSQGEDPAGRVRRRRRHRRGPEDHARAGRAAPAAEHGAVLLRLRFPPHPQQPGLRRRPRRAREEAVPRRPDHHHHPGQQAADGRAGAGRRHGRGQPGQVGCLAGLRRARHGQDPGHGAEHRLPPRSPENSIPS